MTFASCARASIVLAILGFVTSCLTSVCVCCRHRLGLFGIGGFLCFAGLLYFIFAFVKTADDPKRRWLYIWTTIFCLFGGITMFFETDEVRLESHKLTRIVLYSLGGMGLATAFGNTYTLFTRCILKDVMEDAQVTRAEESLMYFSVNLMVGFLLGAMSGLSPNQTGVTIDTKGLVYTIGFWFLDALLMMVVGYLLSRERADMTTKYSSTPASIADGSYTNIA